MFNARGRGFVPINSPGNFDGSTVPVGAYSDLVGQIKRNCPGMSTVYALNLNDNLDTETQCASLNEALTHLRELVLNEMADPDGPIFDRYGLHLSA